MGSGARLFSAATEAGGSFNLTAETGCLRGRDPAPEGGNPTEFDKQVPQSYFDDRPLKADAKGGMPPLQPSVRRPKK